MVFRLRYVLGQCNPSCNKTKQIQPVVWTRHVRCLCRKNATFRACSVLPLAGPLSWRVANAQMTDQKNEISDWHLIDNIWEDFSEGDQLELLAEGQPLQTGFSPTDDDATTSGAIAGTSAAGHHGDLGEPRLEQGTAAPSPSAHHVHQAHGSPLWAAPDREGTPAAASIYLRRLVNGPVQLNSPPGMTAADNPGLQHVVTCMLAKFGPLSPNEASNLGLLSAAMPELEKAQAVQKRTKLMEHEGLLPAVKCAFVANSLTLPGQNLAGRNSRAPFPLHGTPFWVSAISRTMEFKFQ